VKYLEELIKALGLPDGVRPADQFVIDEHVRILFESNQYDRQYELIVTIQPGDPQLDGVIELPKGYVDLMQILCLSPICATDEFAPQTQRAVHLINKVSPLPGFGWDETDNRLFFRHSLILTPETCDHQFLRNSFTSVEQIIDLYFPTMESVALGDVDLNQLMKESSEEFFQNYENMQEFLKET